MQGTHFFSPLGQWFLKEVPEQTEVDRSFAL